MARLKFIVGNLSGDSGTPGTGNPCFRCYQSDTSLMCGDPGEFKFQVLVASLTQSSRTSRENGDVLVQMTQKPTNDLKTSL